MDYIKHWAIKIRFYNKYFVINENWTLILPDEFYQTHVATGHDDVVEGKRGHEVQQEPP